MILIVANEGTTLCQILFRMTLPIWEWVPILIKNVFLFVQSKELKGETFLLSFPQFAVLSKINWSLDCLSYIMFRCLSVKNSV